MIDEAMDPWGRPQFIKGKCRLCGFDEDFRNQSRLNHKAVHPVCNFGSLCDSWTSVLECPLILAPIWGAIQLAYVFIYYWIIVPLIMLFYPFRKVKCNDGDGCYACGEGVELLILICPCIFFILMWPLTLYVFVMGIPCFIIWCYCLIPYHCICFYFVGCVLYRELKYHLRKWTVGLSEEEEEEAMDLQMRKDEVPFC